MEKKLCWIFMSINKSHDSTLNNSSLLILTAIETKPKPNITEHEKQHSEEGYLQS